MENISLVLRPLKPRDEESWEIIERASLVKPLSIETVYYSMDEGGLRARVLEWTMDHTFKQSRVQFIIGTLVYQILPEGIHISSISIIPEVKKGGYLTWMVKRLKGMLNVEYSRFLKVFVREDNRPAIKFFQSNEFRGIAVHKGIFGDRDGFEMVYNIL